MELAVRARREAAAGEVSEAWRMRVSREQKLSLYL
jgi:hypothetical protein